MVGVVEVTLVFDSDRFALLNVSLLSFKSTANVVLLKLIDSFELVKLVTNSVLINDIFEFVASVWLLIEEELLAVNKIEVYWSGIVVLCK